MFFAKRDYTGVRGRILTIAIAPALVVMLIMMPVVYRGNVLQGYQALDRQGQMLTAQLATALEYTLSMEAVDQIPAAIESTVKPAAAVLGTPAIRAVVFDQEGQLLYRGPTPPASSRLEIEPLLTWLVSPDHSQVFMAPVYLEPLGLLAEAGKAKRYLGKVEIELSTASLEMGYFKSFLIDMGLILLTFTAAVGLAHWTGQRFTGAIQGAAQAILRIKSGDLGTRISKTEANEVGILQEGINLLAESIASAQATLEAELTKVRGEYHQALEDLRLESYKAHQASQAKSMFLAKVSHEMRTPLYSIQGLTEQLLTSEHSADEERILRIILASALHLHRIISDILDFNQLEKKKYTPTITALDLWTEIEAAVETIGPLAAQKHLYLDVIVEPNVPQCVLGDGRAFRKSVDNLVSNAVKFTHTGGICLRLGVESLKPDWGQDWALSIRLQVTDTGCGIPAEKLASIFEPFEQVDNALSRRYEGSGLGLSIVKGYCDHLGGQVHVDSAPGRGATFTVTLPFKAAHTEPAGLRQVPTADLAGVRVLVVDERLSFRHSVRCRLGSLGAEVVEQALSPHALVEQTPPTGRYDLVVVQNFSQLEPETLAALTPRLSQWAPHIASLDTGTAPAKLQQLRTQGITVALWGGATRQTLKEELKLTLLAPPPESPPKSAPASPYPNLQEALQGKRVLMAEDFDINREVIAHQLRRHGLHVLEACDGNEAVSLATEPGLDLILMDIQMPGKDGFAAIREIRQLPGCAQLPILGFTASGDLPTHRKIIEAGATTVLTKSISEQELVTALYQALLAYPAQRAPAPPTTGNS